MHIALIGKRGHADTGVGRYAIELAHQLRAHGHQVTVVHPVVPFPHWLVHLLRRWPGWDLEAFFENYPIWANYPAASIYHMTSQNLATLMLFHRPPGETMVTVHDIIPHMVKDDPTVSHFRHIFERILDSIAMWGVKQTGTLLSVSEYTKRCLIEHFDVDPSRVFVTPAGVNAPQREETLESVQVLISDALDTRIFRS